MTRSSKKYVRNRQVGRINSLYNTEPYEGLGFNFSFAELLPAANIQFLIGDIGYLFSSDVGYFYDSLGKLFLKDVGVLRS